MIMHIVSIFLAGPHLQAPPFVFNNLFHLKPPSWIADKFKFSGILPAKETQLKWRKLHSATCVRHIMSILFLTINLWKSATTQSSIVLRTNSHFAFFNLQVDDDHEILMFIRWPSRPSDLETDSSNQHWDRVG